MKASSIFLCLYLGLTLTSLQTLHSETSPETTTATETVHPPTPSPPRALPVAQDRPSNPEVTSEREAYTLASALYDSGNYASAIPQLQAFLERFPNSIDATEISYKLADSLRRTDRVDEARKIFTEIFQLKNNSPFAPFAAMRLAELTIKEGKLIDALPYLDFTISNAPTTGLRLNAIYAKIVVLHDLGRISETPDLLDQLSAVRENNPYLAFAELALGRYYESISDFDTALRHYNRALATSTTADMRAEAGTRAGILALRKGLHNEAIRLFDTTLRLDPPKKWLQQCQLGLLRALAAAGQHSELLRSWDLMQPQIPESLEPEFFYYRANALRSIHPPDLATAQQLYRQIVDKHQQSPYAELASYQLLILEYDKLPAELLIPQLRNFLEKYPESAYAAVIRYLLACAYNSVGKPNEALPLFQRNIDSGQPKEFLPMMRIQISSALLALGKPADALSYLQDFNSQNHSNHLTEQALYLTALAQEANGQLEEALNTWDRLIANYPGSSYRTQAVFRTGVIHAKAERWSETRRAMHRLLSMSSDFPQAREALYWKGLAAFHEGDTQEAKGDFQQLITSSNQTDKFSISAHQHLLLLATKESNSALADAIARRYLQIAQTDSSLPQLSSDLFLWLASSQEQHNNFTEAQFWYEKLLQSTQEKDKLTLAQIGLAKAHLAQNQPETALTTIQQLLQNEPHIANNPELLLLHSQILLACHRPQDALSKALETLSTTQDPQIAGRARLLLGDVYLALDQPQEALKYYSSAGLLYDDPEVSPSALKKSVTVAKKLGLLEDAAKFEQELNKRYQKQTY